VESGENRVERPPRQSWHGNALGANRFNRHDRHQACEGNWRVGWGDGAVSEGIVHRQVSFNAQFSCHVPQSLVPAGRGRDVACIPSYQIPD
jgi:hypothetical protein